MTRDELIFRLLHAPPSYEVYVHLNTDQVAEFDGLIGVWLATAQHESVEAVIIAHGTFVERYDEKNQMWVSTPR